MHSLAASRNGRIIVMVGNVNTKATAGKRMPEDTLVGTTEPVNIRSDPSITGGQGCMRKRCLTN